MLIPSESLKNENGFTLIETMIAMIILAIALLGIAQMQLSAMQGNRSSYDMTEASALASEMMEQMIIQNWKDPTTVACPLADAIVRSNITYTRVCSPGVGSIGQRVFMVTVTWRGEKSNHALSMSSLL